MYESGIEIGDNIVDFKLTQNDDNSLYNNLANTFRASRITKSEWYEVN